MASLLDLGARPELCNFAGDSPLHLAARLDREVCAEILIKYPQTW